MTPDVSSELSELISRGEGATVECKRSLTTDVGRGLCSFANAGGGTVLLGVSDAGKIVGVADHNRLKSRVSSTARSADPPIEVEVESVGDVLRVIVPPQKRLPPGMREADLGAKSMPRNPLLFGMLYRMDVVENIGSGVRRIRDLCREHDVAEPVIDVSGHWVTVTFPRPAVPLDERVVREADGQAGRSLESQPESAPGSKESRPELVSSGRESTDAGLESAGAGLESSRSGQESLERRVLALLAARPLSRSAIADGLGHRSVSAGLNRVIHRLLKDGRAEYTVPNKPNSRFQKYRITQAGHTALEEPAK